MRELQGLTEAALEEVEDEKLKLAREAYAARQADEADRPKRNKAPQFSEEQKAKARQNLKGKAGRRTGELQTQALSSFLSTPELPPDCRGSIIKQLATLALFLEQAVLERHKQVSISSACRIQTCLQWSSHILKVQRWLRIHYAQMSLDQRLNYSREIAAACTMRDKALAALDLETIANSDPWADALSVVERADEPNLGNFEP